MARRFSRLATAIPRMRPMLEALERRDVPSFVATVEYPVGSVAVGEVSGDFNSDGEIDLAVVSNTPQARVGVLLNNHGTFLPVKSYLAGASASSIAAADLNGDGRLDVAVTNPAGGTVSILRGSGTGAFRRPIAFPAGPAPQSVVAADFNNDGKQDLAVVNALQAGTVSVLLGNGDGSFSAFQSYAAGTFARSVDAGDVNNDGSVDLLVAGHEVNCGPHHCPEPANSRVRVLLGTGGGTFSAGEDYRGFESPGDITLGDFSGDGNLDFAVCDVFIGDHYTAHKVVVQLGNGDGTYQDPSYYYMGTSNVSIVAGDLDGDGDIDLAGVKSDARVKVLQNAGNGIFGIGGDYSTDDDARMVIVDDFTLDGKADLTVVHGAPGTVRVIPGLGDGTFVAVLPSFNAGKNPTALTTADFNADGDPDVLVANTASVLSSDGVMNVLLGGAGVTFGPASTYQSGHETRSVAAADFNGDGLIDIAGGNTDDGSTYGLSRITIIPGIGDGNFQLVPSYPASRNSYDMPAGDIDADGDLDLLMFEAGYNGKVIALLGRGDGAFAPPVTLIQGPYRPFFRSLLLRDFNADGKLDIAVGGIITGQRDVVGVSLGNGDGTFLPLVQYDVINFPDALASDDFNEDGIPDLAVLNSFVGFVSVLLGNGDGTFAAADHFATGPEPNDVVVGDFNSDGNLDLITGNYDGASTISILLGNGNGTFQPSVNFGPTLYVYDLDAGDFNGDGDLDLVVASRYPSGLVLLLGNGDGAFQTGVTIPTGASAVDISVADYNADGRLDMVVTNGADNYGFSVHLSDVSGSSTFLPGQHYVPGTDISMTTAGDWDGDGTLDLATVTERLEDLLVMRGQPNGRFDSPLGLVSGQETSDIDAADFNNDGAPDLIAVNADDNTAMVWLLQGDGLFTQPATYATGGKPMAVAVGDMNLDGDLDFAVANSFVNTVTVYLGNGDGTFAVGPTFATGGPPQDVIVADLNNDGKPDLATANSNGTVGILIGRGDGVFMPVQLYAAGPKPGDIVAADLNRDGFLDLAVADSTDGVSVLLNQGDGTLSLSVNYVFGGAKDIVAVDVDGDEWLDLAVVTGNSKLGILLNAADWPAPVPIGKGPRPHAPVDAGGITEEFQPTTTAEPTAVGEPMNPVDVTETAPQRKYASRRIARVALVEPTDAAIELFSMEL